MYFLQDAEICRIFYRFIKQATSFIFNGVALIFSFLILIEYLVEKPCNIVLIEALRVMTEFSLWNSLDSSSLKNIKQSLFPGNY